MWSPQGFHGVVVITSALHAGGPRFQPDQGGTTYCLATRWRYETQGSTEIRTRVAGFKVRSAHHYTIEPLAVPLWYL